MNPLLLFLTTSFIVSVLYYFYMIFSLKPNNNIYSLSSSFECGIDSLGVARNPFSLKFMYITIMFIIFDLEITIIILMPLMQNTYEMMITYFMVILLTFGILIEWSYKNLNWLV